MNANSPSPAEKRRILEGFYAAYAQRDVDAMMQWLTDDIVEDLSGIGYVTGAEEERRFLTGLFASFPDLDTRLTQVVIDEHGATVEWRRTGTFSGAPFQGLIAIGRPFEMRGGAFCEFADGRIRRITGYYDTYAFAVAIGLLPSVDSPAERLLKAAFNLGTRLRKAAPVARRAIH